MKNTAPALVFALLLMTSPALAQTTCADGYALCMGECGNAKAQVPERCMQTCQTKRDSCMTTGAFSVGHQSFRGLQRVLEESPAVSAWDQPRETPQPLRRDAGTPASGNRRIAR
jgi:hypothetical protein